MSVLPKLPSHVQRQLDLEWEDLLDRRKFRGEHLLLHGKWKAFVDERVQRSSEDRRAHVESSYHDSLKEVGLLESSALARERFVQLAEQYLLLWDARGGRIEEFTTHLKEIKANVLDAIADLWKPDADRFERSLRPNLEAEMDSLVGVWTSRARVFELARLRSSDDLDFQRVLREGEKALEQSRKARDDYREAEKANLIDEFVRIGAQVREADQSNNSLSAGATPETPTQVPKRSLDPADLKAERSARITASRLRWGTPELPFAWIHKAAGVDHKDAYDWKNGKLSGAVAGHMDQVLDSATAPAEPERPD